MIRMNAKRESTETWDHDYGPKIVSIIEKVKANVIYMKLFM